MSRGEHAQDVRQFLLMDLEQAWRLVAEVPGPNLDDRKAPLAERNAAFMARIEAFRSVMLHPTGFVPPPLPEEPPGFAEGL